MNKIWKSSWRMGKINRPATRRTFFFYMFSPGIWKNENLIQWGWKTAKNMLKKKINIEIFFISRIRWKLEIAFVIIILLLFKFLEWRRTGNFARYFRWHWSHFSCGILLLNFSQIRECLSYSREIIDGRVTRRICRVTLHIRRELGTRTIDNLLSTENRAKFCVFASNFFFRCCLCHLIT